MHQELIKLFNKTATCSFKKEDWDGEINEQKLMCFTDFKKALTMHIVKYTLNGVFRIHDKVWYEDNKCKIIFVDYITDRIRMEDEDKNIIWGNISIIEIRPRTV